MTLEETLVAGVGASHEDLCGRAYWIEAMMQAEWESMSVDEQGQI